MWWSEFSDLRRAWDPFRDVQRLHGEMNRLFSRATVPYAQNFPAINLWAGEDDIVLTAELPGINVKDLDITIKGDVLTLSGSRLPEELKEGETYHRQERGLGRFSRVINLPFRVDQQKVAAQYERGVLTLALPRMEEDKPKKIEIKTQ